MDIRTTLTRAIGQETQRRDNHHPQSSRATSKRETYNYRRFRFWPYHEGIQRGVQAGDQAVDETVYTLQESPVQLSDLWNNRPIVIEFGSVTCPIFAAKVDAMDNLAEKYADRVDFYVVYTREAHPGLHYPRHMSFEQKLRHTKDAREYESIDRPILVDDVDGTMHRAYDALPNSVHVIGRDGVVAHRADWVEPDQLDRQLEELLAHDGQGEDVTPTNVEENYHQPDIDLLKTTLRVNTRAGPGSLRDMVLAAPRMLAHRAQEQLSSRL